MRNLATVQKIYNIKEIPGADNISVANILGWQVVVKKDEFKEGDLVIYCEIDSVLPEKPEFEFLRNRKFRIKTIKLKNTISQGICFPINILPFTLTTNYHIGTDVTEILDIKKYDIEAMIESKVAERNMRINTNRFTKFLCKYSWFKKLFFKPVRSVFPTFIKKTDEPRIQLIDQNQILNNTFSITEKLDGKSMTVFLLRKKYWFYSKYIFGVCSRNYNIVNQTEDYWQVAIKLNLKELMKKYVNDNKLDAYILQGELVGPWIQGNKYKLIETKFYIFNNIAYKHNVMYHEEKKLDLDYVPVLEENYLVNSVDDLIEYSNKFSKINPNVLMEGIVCRSFKDPIKMFIDISFKVVNPEFLLRYDN